MSQTTQNQNSETEERPLFVKSQNFSHSKNLRFPDEPPTDKQINYMKKLGYDPSEKFPETRLEASNMIKKLLNQQTLDQINESRKRRGLPLKTLEEIQ